VSKININKTEFRVRYSDTDHFGVVYYANYLNWLEAGRTEILRDNGITYSELEKKGMFAPVVRLEVDWKDSARYDDFVIVETRIDKIGNSSVQFSYDLYRKGLEKNHLLATAKTVNVFITRNGEKVTVPEEIRKILDN
jgi:acyl-CoA thioester hydrolase